MSQHDEVGSPSQQEQRQPHIAPPPSFDEAFAASVGRRREDREWPTRLWNLSPSDTEARNAAPLSSPGVGDADQVRPPAQKPTISASTDTGKADLWAQTAANAVAFARRVDTPEAWRAVATSASVLSQMAQTLEIVAEATQRATRLALESQDAERVAQAAAAAAAKAARTVQELGAAVAKASEVNSASAWIEAHAVVQRALEKVGTCARELDR